jgi:chloride channel protein, CIC family
MSIGSEWAGAGMAAAYSVPLGGAIFAVEVLRGALSLRLVIPALAAALIAIVTATFAIPNLPTYSIPAYEVSVGAIVWALITATIFALFSVLFVRAIAWADRNRPTDWLRFVAPIVVLTSVGLISIPFPQVLGNGKDITQILFSNQMPLFPLVLYWCLDRQRLFSALPAALRAACSLPRLQPGRCLELEAR